MHQYLKAIGFENIHTTKELQSLLHIVEKQCTHQTIVSYKRGEEFCEYQKEFGKNMGITVCGEKDDANHFQRSYYFPYFAGSGVSTYADISVERKIEQEQYVGMCEDSKIGICLIFTIQNGVEYIRERQLGIIQEEAVSITFSGLATAGVILLPVVKTEKQIERGKAASDNRKMLLNAARKGDQTAIETLTLDDMDLYSKVSRRLVDEDVFTIVDTYFMPYGIECDLYSIMGEILSIIIRKNPITGIDIYQMKLSVNELEIDVCVPTHRVMGEPEVGRRFKGTIWLQGFINF